MSIKAFLLLHSPGACQQVHWHVEAACAMASYARQKTETANYILKTISKFLPTLAFMPLEALGYFLDVPARPKVVTAVTLFWMCGGI